MKNYKIDRKRGYESNRRTLDIEGKERQRAKKEAKNGLQEPSEFDILQDVKQVEYDRESLNSYLKDELGEILDKELNQ